LKLLNLI